MQYTRVKKPHIVPKFQLRNFSSGDQICVRLLPGGQTWKVSVNDAAVRRDFYSRTRPDGTRVDDVEWSLSQIESAAGPLLPDLQGAWPLTHEDKAKVAELFAYQAVRGPRWRAWHECFTRNAVAQKRREGFHEMKSGLLVPLSDQQLDGFENHLLSDTQRLIRMLAVGKKLITIFGSMTWDLVTFDEPLLAISDHPVVEVPLGAGRRFPTLARGHGLLNVLEVQIPVAPDLALLMTWKDAPDSAHVLRGAAEHAENLNGFVIAQAERQWMWKPGTTPATGAGPFYPLSADLCPGYGDRPAKASAVRARVSQLVNARLGEQLSPGQQEAEIVFVG
jgi:hypothetical protein